MVKFAFEKVMTGEELREMIQKELGSEYRVQVKRNRIEIVQDTTKACLFVFKENNGRTECSSPSGYMPLGLEHSVLPLFSLKTKRQALVVSCTISMRFLFTLSLIHI